MPCSGEKRFIATLVVAAAIVMVAAGCTEEPAPKTRRLSLIATGQLKGNLYPQVRHYSRGRTRTLGGFAALTTRINELIAERAGRSPTLVVDLGGNLAGSAESHASSGKIVVAMMNHVPYAASLLSNLEFIYGQAVLKERTAQARFPFLASNLTFADVELARRVRREITTDLEGIKVTMLGVAPLGLVQISAPEVVSGVTVDPDLTAVLAAAAAAKKAGSTVVVALAKLPVDRPVPAIRDAVSKSQLDVLVGIDYGRTGFSTQKWGRTVVAGVPADAGGARVLTLDLEIAGGAVNAAEPGSAVEIVSPEVTAPDRNVARELDGYERENLAPMRVKLGSAKTELTRAYKAESTLGNVVADAMRRSSGARIALLNAGAIQDDLMAGDITLRDLFRVLPFDNTIVTVPATGDQISRLIQEILDRGSRYHVSGASYRVREAAQGGDRLLALEVGGRPAGPTEPFTLATTDYILKRTGLFRGTRESGQGSLREALATYLKGQAGPLIGRVEGRVVFERPPEPKK
ncbi:MAG: bifunctional metallophosphatase/5'-nucleotidase [Candidatus Riflebacteria bacterium]|nr:bifunctional metallophosphatase/5'-nucleotidase [Candidatus Riflebacteria bacterium]